MNFDPGQLALFTGTQHYYRLSRNCLLTDGAKYLAEGASAYWLMDAVASYLSELGTDDWFVLVRLETERFRAVLFLEDGNSHVRIKQEIPHTDFPLARQILY